MVPGRKSDVNDAQWLQRLHACGLLRASFRPGREIAALREYLRLRERHVQDAAAAHKQHMQKALTYMNLQLHHVVSEIARRNGPANDSGHPRRRTRPANTRSYARCSMPRHSRDNRSRAGGQLPARTPVCAQEGRRSYDFYQERDRAVRPARSKLMLVRLSAQKDCPD